MISGLEGTAVWAIVMTTAEVDGRTASANFSAEVLAIAASERVANDLAYDLVPYIPRGAQLSIEETKMVDS